MRYCLHVKAFLGDENNIYIRTAQNTNLTPFQNIYEERNKQLEGFYH